MSLKQAVDMLNENKVFVMYTTTGCRAFSKEPIDLDNQTVAYFDCNFMPGLMDVGEWDWYLTQEGATEIKDSDKIKRIADQKSITHKEYYSIHQPSS